MTTPPPCTLDEKKLTKCKQGTCYFVIINGQRQPGCRCNAGYTGKYCDEKIPGISSLRKRNVPTFEDNVAGLPIGDSTSSHSTSFSAVYTTGLVLGMFVIAVLALLLIAVIWKKLTTAASTYKRLSSEDPSDEINDHHEAKQKRIHPVKMLKHVKQRTAPSASAFLFQELTPEDTVFDQYDDFGGLEIIPNAGSSVQ